MLAILCLFSFKMDIWNLLEQSLEHLRYAFLLIWCMAEAEQNLTVIRMT